MAIAAGAGAIGRALQPNPEPEVRPVVRLRPPVRAEVSSMKLQDEDPGRLENDVIYQRRMGPDCVLGVSDISAM
jgi:hypothetical protein